MMRSLHWFALSFLLVLVLPAATAEETETSGTEDVATPEASGGELDASEGEVSDTLQNSAEGAASVVEAQEGTTAAQEGTQEGGWLSDPKKIGGVVAILLLVGAIGFFLWKQRQVHMSRGEREWEPPSAGRTPGRKGSEITAEARARGAATPFASRGEFDALESKVGQMEAEVHRLRSAMNQQAYQVQQQAAAVQRAPTAPLTPIVPSPAPTPQSPGAPIAQAFVQWCRGRGPLASKMDLFSGFIAENVPGTSVERVFRDLDSPARPIRFDAHGGNSPAEYWLTHLGGAHYLLPMPQGPAQFRDLSNAFEGHATPATIQSITPAPVTHEGGQYVLVQPGRIG